MNLPNVILQTKRAGQPIQIQRLGYWLICLLIICCCMNTSKAADYVWSPTNLYNATHPTSSFPWSTQWVAAPDGGQSIEVTIASGGGYYNFIAIPESYLGSGTDFKNIYYPGLISHPQHELAKKQQLDPNGEPGFGAMISIDLETLDRAAIFCKNLKIFTLAESLGGVESLICHPAKMTHASLGAEKRKKLGISDGLLRLSVGVEDADDLIDALEVALSSI